jgi:membrane-associated PAP2 superfamily phosphatase
VSNSVAVRCVTIAAALACIVAVLSVSLGIDVGISDAVFSGSGDWPISHEPGLMRAVFYDGPVRLLGLLAVWLAAGAAYPALLRPVGLSRRESLYILVCLVSTPLLIGTLKHFSGVACAYDLVRYGGTTADALGHHPFTRAAAGGCWPAAHPSGAFALLCLGALNRRASVRVAMWSLALAAGTILGIYQVARGAHFASHVVITALIGQALACLFAAMMLPRTQAEITSTPPM